jgi:hypothetical protein
MPYGQSIIDVCLGWDDRANVIDVLAAAVKARPPQSPVNRRLTRHQCAERM